MTTGRRGRRTHRYSRSATNLGRTAKMCPKRSVGFLGTGHSTTAKRPLEVAAWILLCGLVGLRVSRRLGRGAEAIAHFAHRARDTPQGARDLPQPTTLRVQSFQPCTSTRCTSSTGSESPTGLVRHAVGRVVACIFAAYLPASSVKRIFQCATLSSNAFTGSRSSLPWARKSTGTKTHEPLAP